MGLRAASINTNIIEENGTPVGIRLGYDFTAEHEWGSHPLFQRIGILAESSQLIEDYLIRNGKEIELIETTISKAHVGILQTIDEYKKIFGVKKENPVCDDLEGSVKYEIKNKHKDFIKAAWCEKSFQIIVGGYHIPFLRELHKAILEKNAVLFFSGDHFWNKSGLTLCIFDRIPADAIKQGHDSKKEHDKISRMVKKSKIVEKLKKAKCEYYTLSPKLEDGNLKFWLNPKQQNKYNAGWMTIEDLQDWIVGKGRILKMEQNA